MIKFDNNQSIKSFGQSVQKDYFRHIGLGQTPKTAKFTVNFLKDIGEVMFVPELQWGRVFLGSVYSDWVKAENIEQVVDNYFQG